MLRHGLVIGLLIAVVGGVAVAGGAGSDGQAVAAGDTAVDSGGRANWADTFGGNSSDGFTAVRFTSGGGCVVAGYEASWGFGGKDAWVMKLDGSGNKAWSATFGGHLADRWASVDLASDGGYLVAGREVSWGQGDRDGWVMKLDASGGKVWATTLGGPQADYLYSVRETPDGGCIVAGQEESWGAGVYDAWVSKLDSSGSKTWSTTFGGSAADGFLDIGLTSDGGYIAVGYVKSWGQGGADGWVMKLDASGNKVWARTFGGTSDEGLYSVQETSDGGYIVAGYEASWGSGGQEGWVLKLDSTGNNVWARTFGGTSDDRFYSVRQTSDGGYIVAGYEESWGLGGRDTWLVRLDSTGNKLWSKTFGGSSDDWFTGVDETVSGGYVVAGFESSWGQGAEDGWVMELNSSGN